MTVKSIIVILGHSRRGRGQRGRGRGRRQGHGRLPRGGQNRREEILPMWVWNEIERWKLQTTEYSFSGSRSCKC